MEVLMYLDELETRTTEDEEIPTPKFALQRVHDILFVIGGIYKNWIHADYFESYCPRTDQWTKVSGTQLHSYCAFLSNYKPRNTFEFWKTVTTFSVKAGTKKTDNRADEMTSVKENDDHYDSVRVM
jgi:hypothetical protein